LAMLVRHAHGTSGGRLLMDLIRVQAQAAHATVSTRLHEDTHRTKMRKVGAYVDNDYPW